MNSENEENSYSTAQYVYESEPNLEEPPQSNRLIVNECRFNFANMKNEIKVVLAKYDHSKRYMTVKNGLNLKGKCFNKECIAFEKPVWISKGYGTFNIAKERYFNKCTCCDVRLNSDTIRTLGYMMCKITLEGGKAENGQEQNFSEEKEEKTGQFVKFRDYDEDILKWDYIEVKVEKIA